MLASLLDDLATIRITGTDRHRFLQGQLTHDVERLTAETVLTAALLTPQGRVIALPRFIERDGATVLVLPASLVAPVVAHLKRYVLRAKLTLEVPGDELALAGVVPQSPGEFEARFGAIAAGKHARLAGGESLLRQPGYAWLLAPRAQLTALLGAADHSAAPAALELAAIESGEPTVLAATSGEWIPQMLNLDRIDAISFSKGCYTGQEIVARTQHLGRIKRRMLRYRARNSTVAAPLPGAALSRLGHKAAEVVRASAAPGGTELLAVVNLEAARETLFDAGGAEYHPEPLPYALE